MRSIDDERNKVINNLRLSLQNRNYSRATSLARELSLFSELPTELDDQIPFLVSEIEAEMNKQSWLTVALILILMGRRELENEIHNRVTQLLQENFEKGFQLNYVNNTLELSLPDIPEGFSEKAILMVTKDDEFLFQGLVQQNREKITLTDKGSYSAFIHVERAVNWAPLPLYLEARTSAILE
jgi:hypothetical protein